jgi:small subunit ribosomal protein S3
MIEREIVSRQIKEHQIMEFIEANLNGAGFSGAVVKRTPLGEKIIIFSSRPGMVVGRSGKNIKDLTDQLKVKFDLENPQIEIAEVPNPVLNSNIVAERITTSLERFGPTKFKSIIHRAVEDTMNGGALGIEVLLSGKVPSARARRWRVSQGYLKKCGEPAIENVDIAYKVAKLKSGIVGIVVKIMPPGVELPDSIKVIENVIRTPAVEPEAPKQDLEKGETPKKRKKAEAVK